MISFRGGVCSNRHCHTARQRRHSTRRTLNVANTCKHVTLRTSGSRDASVYHTRVFRILPRRRLRECVDNNFRINALVFFLSVRSSDVHAVSRVYDFRVQRSSANHPNMTLKNSRSDLYINYVRTQHTRCSLLISRRRDI